MQTKKLFFLGIGLLISVFLTNSAFSGNVKLGVAWMGKSDMTLRVVKGMDQALNELAPEIEVEYQKELKGLEALASVLKRFQAEKSGMVALRSNAASYLGQHPPTIPTFIGGCNHPVQLGAVRNMDAPEGNITGVTYAIPYMTKFETFAKVLPNIKSLLILHEDGHASTELDRQGTQAVCKQMNIQYNEVVSKKLEDSLEAVKKARESVDVIVIGSNALNFDNGAAIVAAAGMIPVISYTKRPVLDGVLCGLAADDVKLGQLLGQSIVDVLVKGKAIKAVPIKTDPDPQFYINTKTAKKLGLEIPYEVLNLANLVD